ncbi:MAG TPA: hypothetical protein VMU38_04210 [Candidatus Binatia bacterium]|nr:hypothetical protein [Candidatus Binatia bacterium]
MPLFPPGAPVTVLLDGRPLAAYVRAYVANGRVYATASPLLTRVADRFWLDGATLVLERGERRVRVALPPSLAGQLDAAYVAAGPPLRALGASVRYDAGARRLTVSTSTRGAIASPTPFDPAAPSVAPNAVFTPMESPTPRPIWTGSPMPRRTPLPLAPARPPGSSTTPP